MYRCNLQYSLFWLIILLTLRHSLIPAATSNITRELIILMIIHKTFSPVRPLQSRKQNFDCRVNSVKLFHLIFQTSQSRLFRMRFIFRAFDWVKRPRLWGLSQPPSMTLETHSNFISNYFTFSSKIHTQYARGCAFLFVSAFIETDFLFIILNGFSDFCCAQDSNIHYTRRDVFLVIKCIALHSCLRQ